MSFGLLSQTFLPSTRRSLPSTLSHSFRLTERSCFTMQDPNETRDNTATEDGQNTRVLPRPPATANSASRRRERPPLRYTEDFSTPDSVQLGVIGVVRSPYKERFGTPRQPCVTENTLGNQAQAATIELYKGSRFELGLRGLAEFEYCWVVSFFHLNQGFNPLVTPPRGPRKKQGVFATRSPHRPNSIGLSCIRITSVDEKTGIINLLGVDLLDGTAVLDIKPYVPYCDAYPNARAGWLDKLEEDMKAPDSLGYHPPPAHLMRAVPPRSESHTSHVPQVPLSRKEGSDDKQSNPG